MISPSRVVALTVPSMRRAAGATQHGRFRQAEIKHLHGAIRRDLDVGGLQIAVDDPLLVGGVECRRDLPRDVDGLRRGEDRGRCALPGSSGDEFHDDRGRAPTRSMPWIVAMLDD